MGDAAPPSTPTPPSWSRTFNYYNPLSRRSKHRAAPAPPAIYSRDFAYANNEAVVLAQQEPQPVMCAPRAEINCETSAKTFAEYVVLFHRPTPPPHLPSAGSVPVAVVAEF